MLHPVFCPLLMRLGAKSKSNRDLACVFLTPRSDLACCTAGLSMLASVAAYLISA